MKNPLTYKYQKPQRELEQTEAVAPVRKARKEPVDTAGKTENFFTRNIKAITFFICLAVFLAVFGPMSIFRIMEIVEERRVDGEVMQVEDVLYLAEQRKQLTMSQVTVFDGDEQEIADVGMYYRIKVDDVFLVTVGTETSEGWVTYFTVTRLSTGESIDVLGATFRIKHLQSFLETP